MKPHLIALAVTAALGAAAPAVHAAAVTDGSLGAVQSLSGRFTVPQSLGQVRGANLFHSFGRFSIASGETATFTTVDPGLRHVIARVTGGEASLLQGPLALQAAGGAQPDFWLLNPSGVLVGAGASFDLPAGLHLGAAPQLRLADGSIWSTHGTEPSTLSVAAPERFGFLGPGSGGPLVVQDAVLAPPLGAALTLAGVTLTIERAQLSTALGDLRLQAAGLLRLGAGSSVDASGLGIGAGRLLVEAGQIDATAGATLTAWHYGDGRGDGAALDVAGTLTLAGGASLSSYTEGSGQAGALVVRAGQVRVSGEGENGASTISSFGQSGPSGAVTVTADTVTVTDGARIGSSHRSDGAPGAVQLNARSITVDGGGKPSTISSLSTGSGPAAAVTVQAGEALSLRNGGQIFGSTLGDTDAGSVTVASPVIELHGGSAVTGIFAGAFGRGRGGAVAVDATQLTLTDGARISTTTNSSSSGSAGSVVVAAHRIAIDGRGRATGIDSFAYGNSGDAGQVQVLARERLDLLRGGAITAGTLGSGSPGTIAVQAGTLQLDGRGAAGSFTGIAGDALFAGTGAAVTVQATRLEVLEGSGISTSTQNMRDGQPLRVQADSLLIDGGGNATTATGISADTGGAGDAGSLTIQAREINVVGEGLVSTSTLGSGRGGAMDIQVSSVRLATSGGLASVAGGSGDAGRIELRASGSIDLVDGGFVVASSGGAGAAGSIRIQAGRFTAAGTDAANGQRSRIASRALAGSSGDSGRIEIVVDGAFTLADGALLSIANDAREVTAAAAGPSFIRVQAAQVTLTGAEITAAAGGPADAGAIALASADGVRLTDSALRTSAHSGNGGPIAIDAAGAVLLRNAAITTSVDGRDGGDGGNIRIAGQGLALASGFVQANTAAARASGGTVTIDVPVLVPDGNNVFVGGNRIAAFRPDVPGYNVIQAAAPDGLAGRLDVTRPELNLAGSLTALIAQRIDFGLLGRDPCEAGIDSSFTILGRGALPAPASAPLRIRP